MGACSKWKRSAYLTPKPVEVEELRAGEVGFLIANIKTVADTQNRRHHYRRCAIPRSSRLPGFEEIKPMVFAGLYPWTRMSTPSCATRWKNCGSTTASFFFEPENSVALGFGFRCGFLGLLHMEIIQERLEREFNLDLITTAPGVRYRSRRPTATLIEVDNPSKMPGPERDCQGSRNRSSRPRSSPTKNSSAGSCSSWKRSAASRRSSSTSVAARDAALRAAAERDRARFLRPAEVGLARVRVARLSPCRATASRRW